MEQVVLRWLLRNMPVHHPRGCFGYDPASMVLEVSHKNPLAVGSLPALALGTRIDSQPASSRQPVSQACVSAEPCTWRFLLDLTPPAAVDLCKSRRTSLSPASYTNSISMHMYQCQPIIDFGILTG